MDPSCCRSAGANLKASARPQSCCRGVPIWLRRLERPLTFGLIRCPSACLRRLAANESVQPAPQECLSRLKQLVCPVCIATWSGPNCEGLRIRKGSVRAVSEEELDKIEPSPARVMEILEFVNWMRWNPLYFDSSYYISPEDAGVKAYQRL